MHPLIDQQREAISRICPWHHIRRLEVFGSAARATDFDSATSDADFLVEFGLNARRGLDSYFALKFDLEALQQAVEALLGERHYQTPAPSHCRHLQAL